MSVTTKDVTYIAELAKLKFSDDEMLTMTDELNNILHYIDTVSYTHLTLPTKRIV